MGASSCGPGEGSSHCPAVSSTSRASASHEVNTGDARLTPAVRGLVKGGGSDSEPEVVDVLCPGGPFTCFICIETKTAEERFLPHRCAVLPEKLCCKQCYSGWVESQIDSESADIRCCHCDKRLTSQQLSRLVDAEHWQKYCDTALMLLLRRDRNFIWCSKCAGGGWVDPSQPSSKCGWNCPECSTSFVYCPHCRREHGSLTCKRFQQLRHEVLQGQRAAGEKQSEGLVAQSSKMCPSCKMPIQKDGGCNFMDCPNCRRHFCWSCGHVLKASHQQHKCDMGFETSQVVHRTPNGMACVELTRMFANVLDLDGLELLNVDGDDDLASLREMLVPGLTEEPRSPLFVGPSACDGEIILRLSFNFQKSIAWEITHIMLRADHPPAPSCLPPRSVSLLPNVEAVSFNDFDDPTVLTVDLQEGARGSLLLPLEQFRTKGTFRGVTSLAMRLSIKSLREQTDPESANGEDDAQVFLNDLAIFGLPGASKRANTQRGSMYDERANLIVSPVLKSRWGEQVVEDTADDQAPHT